MAASFPNPFMTDSRYETSNVHLASFLFSQGAILIGHERVSPRRTVFSFRSDEKLHDLLRRYWRNEPMPIIAVQLFSALQQLKSRIRRRTDAAPSPSLP